MIKSFDDKGLRLFWEQGNARRLAAPAHADRIKLILEALDAAVRPTDMNRPGWDFHRWQGRERYSVKVSGNWRVLWYWDAGAVDVTLEDPHS
jgi:proteic killer suppression protein